MTETIQVCAAEVKQVCGKCHQLHCDGRLWVVPYKYEYYKTEEGHDILCTSQLDEPRGCHTTRSDSAIFYEIIVAHGASFMFRAFPWNGKTIPEPEKWNSKTMVSIQEMQLKAEQDNRPPVGLYTNAKEPVDDGGNCIYRCMPFPDYAKLRQKIFSLLDRFHHRQGAQNDRMREIEDNAIDEFMMWYFNPENNNDKDI